MHLIEGKVCISVELLGSISVNLRWGNKSDEDDNTSHVEKFGYLADSADVLGSGSVIESKTLIETSTDNITIEDEDLAGVSESLVHMYLNGLRKGRFTST